jgi:hypothetical protein
MSIKKHFYTFIITAVVLGATSTHYSYAQQSFGGVQFSGVGVAILGCLSQIDAIQEKILKLKERVNSIVNLQILGFKAPAPTPVMDELARSNLKKANRKEQCTDPTAYALANFLTSSFVESTINWATTGFNGTPFFIRDEGTFFENVERDFKQTFLNNIPNANDIYGNAIRYAMIAQETGRRASKSALRGQNDAAVQQIEDFTNDFKKGGWRSFFNTTQFSSQNPIGAYFSASYRLERAKEELIEAQKRELDRGDGFLGQKKCVEWGAAGPEGRTVRNPITGEEMRMEPNCLKYEVVTPGSLIKEQTAKATGAMVDRTLVADELNETIGRFLDRMLSNLANRGLASLSRTRKNVIQTGPNASTAQRTIEDFRGSFDENNFSITNPRHLQAIIKAQKDYLSVVQDSQIASEESLALLGKLDYCIPGPNENMPNQANQVIPIIADGYRNGFISKKRPRFRDFAIFGAFARIFNRNDFRALQPIPFIVPNPVIEGDFILNDTIYVNEYADNAEEQQLFAGNIQDFSVDYLNIFRKVFSRKKIIANFENTQTTQQKKDIVRGSIQSALLETRRLPEYSKNTKTLLLMYEQSAETTRENIAELESIHREILDIVENARNRHIAQQKALGVTVNLECLDIQYDVSNPLITGRIRREQDGVSENIKTLREAEASFFDPDNLYRDHSLPFWSNL